MAWDGEGATCLIEVGASGAADDAGARAVARAVASSSLVKAAIFGHDPNWGRIACAAGCTPCPESLACKSLGDESPRRAGMNCVAGRVPERMDLVLGIQAMGLADIPACHQTPTRSHSAIYLALGMHKEQVSMMQREGSAGTRVCSLTPTRSTSAWVPSG